MRRTISNFINYNRLSPYRDKSSFIKVKDRFCAVSTTAYEAADGCEVLSSPKKGSP